MIKAEGRSIDGFLIGETYEHADIHVGPERLALGKVGSDKANQTQRARSLAAPLRKYRWQRNSLATTAQAS